MTTSNFNPIEFLDQISLLDPDALIAILEKGIELERLEGLATNDPDAESRIRQARLLLSFLYTKKFGL